MLLEVQKKALDAGYGKPGFAYFCEMGLGKTLTALTEFVRLVREGEVSRLVVICPNSFKAGWAEEIKKHGLDLDHCIYNAGNDAWHEKFLKTVFEKPPVFIVNYESVRSEEVRTLIARFVGQREAMLVIDESIQIKTHDSEQTRGVLAIAGLFKYKRLLSGKPVTTGPHDLWAQFKTLGVINDKYWPWKVTYCKMGGFKGKKVVGTQNEELLAAKIDRFVFRASKAEWTDLPPKIYTTREYKLMPRLEKQYKQMEEEFVVWLNETENVAVDTFITKYIKMMQIQSGFIIREDGTTQELVKPIENARFQLVREIIEGVNGKVVVPYVHRYTSGMLARILEHYHPAVIRGQMEPFEIEAEKHRFNRDPDCRVILVQIRAGKYGHTLLGGEGQDRCSTMIFAENSYSLDDRSQIEDRIHRHGQTADSCLYVDLWGTDLDHRVCRALQAKEDLAQAVFAYFGIH